MKKSILLSAAMLLAAASWSWAVESPNVELGKKLYEWQGLGSNGKSCSSCHPGGKGLEEISAYDDGMLMEMINFCIRDALKGEMLAPQSQELESMLLYLRSLPGK
ncbi:c-type cytochrome [Desulfuromonas versatilis]|uniref:C-type cytochrome n=1 Tax=Desulfuromonas versatilis TaxID=2802975 RepID=A0ABM8HVT8_9BACT|nr:cytochrome-c peroxidase [Desulfuromonas versatilis]BCR04840.1 c-type cytochrome [Desulfuromonas versatilis]